jgi:hypothetical protein
VAAKTQTREGKRVITRSKNHNLGGNVPEEGKAIVRKAVFGRRTKMRTWATLKTSCHRRAADGDGARVSVHPHEKPLGTLTVLYGLKVH